MSRVIGIGQVELPTKVDGPETEDVVSLGIGLDLFEDEVLVPLTTTRPDARHC